MEEVGDEDVSGLSVVMVATEDELELVEPSTRVFVEESRWGGGRVNVNVNVNANIM